MKHGLIAIIDDDELDRHIYKKIILLTCPSYRIIDFSNGLEALHYMRKNHNNEAALPDILLLDVRMPVFNGWQYLKQYNKMKSRLAKPTRHYICSSSIERFDGFKNEDLHGYYLKPLSPKDISKIVLDTEQYYQAS